MVEGAELGILKLLAEARVRLYQNGLPDDPDAIQKLSEEKVALAALKINVFGANVDKREKYSALYERAVEIWGEYPESPIGMYAVRSFWTEKEAPNVTVSELVNDRNQIIECQVEYYDKLSERRKNKLVNRIDRYETREAVPDGLPAGLRSILQGLTTDDDADDDDDDAEAIVIDVE